ncbi:MAG: exodeoxyribonuclease VII small subunit [Pyrinomonadaceae bacterium]
MSPNQNFETSLAALEKIVRDLEAGELPLEESLKLFEDGVRLSRECQERLAQAERRIEVLTRDADGKPLIESLSDSALQEAKEKPKAKRRYVFESDDDEDKAEDESVF